MKTEFSIRNAKAGTDHLVSWDSLPEASKEYIIAYGLTQSLNDAHAGAKEAVPKHNKENPNNQLSVAEWAEIMFEKKLKSILAGTIGMRASPAGSDPVGKELDKLLGAAMGKKWTGLEKADKAERLSKLLAGEGSQAAQDIVARARRNVEEATRGLDLGL